MKAVAYCRYSSEAQRDGHSIEAQLSAIKDYCARENMTLVGEYIDEAKSGRTAERDEFQKMIADASEHKFDVVVVHKLDRFSRERYDFAVYRRILRNNQIALRSVLERIDDTPESIILESMLEGMSEYYSKNLSRETKKGLYARARKGLVCSNRPFGYDVVDSKFVINEADVEIVRDIFRRVILGESLASIGRSLEEKKIRGARGGVFEYNNLRKIIRNTIYYGDYTFGGEVVSKAVVNPILSFDTWIVANAKLDEKSRKVYKRYRTEDYMLTGILFCGQCGGHYSGHCSHGRNGKVYRRYRCSNSAKAKCSASVFLKDDLESFIVDAVTRDLSSDQTIAMVTEQLYIESKKRLTKSDYALIKKELDSTKRKKERILDVYIDGKISKEEFTTRAAGINERIRILESKLSDAGNASLSFSKELIRASLKYYYESLRSKTIDNPALFITTLVEKITVYDDRFDIVYLLSGHDGQSLKSSISFGALKANSGGGMSF